MSLEDEILSQIDTAQLAQQLGTDPETAAADAAQAIRALVGGMAKNAADPQGEASLAGALGHHAQASTLFNTPGLDIDEVDQEDGAKIVNHVLGSDEEFGGLAAANTGGESGTMPKLLKILAPIVLAYIAKQLTQKQADAGSTDVLGQAAGGEGGGILGQILGGALGGDQGQAGQQAGGGILGQILGGLLGGGR